MFIFSEVNVSGTYLFITDRTSWVVAYLSSSSPETLRTVLKRRWRTIVIASTGFVIPRLHFRGFTIIKHYAKLSYTFTVTVTTAKAGKCELYLPVQSQSVHDVLQVVVRAFWVVAYWSSS